MRRKFESSDPLRRGSRRPPSSALKAAALKHKQQASSSASVTQPPAADLTQRKPPADMHTAGFQEFALKMCSEEDISGTRHHVLKFFSRATVDPAGQFTPPIRLHRKDPKQLQVIAGQEDMKMDMDNEVNAGMDDGLGPPGVGPVAGSTEDVLDNTRFDSKRRGFGSKRKTRQIHGGEKNDAARKLRYEEHFPWVMEDFDNKNTWVSSYEAAQSNNFAVLAYDSVSNGFKLIPVEKYYKMTPSARYATLSLEDAEERMESAHSMRDRWLMSSLQPRVGEGVNVGEPHAEGPRLRTVVGSEERQHKYNLDEEMDYDDQEMFDDDEGAPLLDGPEEELKEAEERIKREQLKANELMDAGQDQDLDSLFADTDLREDKQGKRVRKALRSLEKNQYYDSDDEDNPYVSSDDASDSQDELDKLDPNSTTLNELGTKIKREHDEDIHSAMVLPLVSQFRKRHIDRNSLPRGTVVLQLPPNLLQRFPTGFWNPNVKREEVSQPTQEDPNLLTHEDVRSHIVSGETDIKQLLNSLKPKLALHPDNINRLKQFVKEVARSKNKKLFLRA